MKIKYLGTAAAEGVPAIFCHCEVCKYAREHKGKNIRTRSQAMIDDSILVDFGPDTYLHLLQYDLDITELEHCLITHVHKDHLGEEALLYRKRGFANLKEGTKPLTVYGSQDVGDALKPDENGKVTEDGSLFFRELKPYEPVQIGEYTITTLPAYHGTDNPLFYMIEKDGKCLLYAHDTDIVKEEVWEYLVQNQIRFDLVSMDCTEGLKHIEYHGHMNLERDMIVKNRMLENGIANEKTIFICNHFSHNGQATYEAACEFAAQNGLVISYDGMEVEI